jgi:hypothetical protein
MSRLTHGLPPVPPLEPHVQDRILQNVLTRMDAPAPSRSRRSMPLLTAAAVLLVAIAVTIATTLVGTWSDPRPAVGGPTTEQVLDPLPPEPLPADRLPPPTGDPDVDAAIARCATAVVRSGRAAEYPPTTTWRGAQLDPVPSGYLDRLLTIDDAFGCLLTPESVMLSGLTGTPVGGLQLVRVNPSTLIALNPQELWFAFGDQPRPWIGYPVMTVPLPSEDDDGLTITVREPGDVPGSERGGGGDNGVVWSGPVPELVQGVTVVDRVLPRRADTLDDVELTNCVSGRSPLTVAVAGTGDELWTPAGRHDVGDAAPTALVARIDDVAAGICVVDPRLGPRFGFDRLPAKPEPGQVLINMDTGATVSVLLTAPGEELTRIEIAPAADPAGSRACTVVDGLVVCTLETDGAVDDAIITDVVVTAYTAGSAEGKVLYPVG